MITSNVQDEFDYKRLGIATAFGAGLGTAFEAHLDMVHLDLIYESKKKLI